MDNEEGGIGSDAIYQLAQRDLSRLLAANADRRERLRDRSKLGALDPGVGSFWVCIPNTNDEVHLKRPSELAPYELQLLDPYGRFLEELAQAPINLAEVAKDDAVLQAIAAQIGGESKHVITAVLRYLHRLGGQTYEGQAVTVTLLVDMGEPEEAGLGESLEDYGERSWHAIPGSGLESGLLIDREGHVVRQEDLSQNPDLADCEDGPRLAPDIFKKHAAWTDDKPRVAMTLTRGGEIIIHQEGVARYVYRLGAWRTTAVDYAQQCGWGEGTKPPRLLNKAVLAAALDASFAHHGACVGVLSRSSEDAFEANSVLADEQRWEASGLGDLYGKNNFFELTRRQRLELMSLDGATVLDRDGLILAAGAILKIAGGTKEGGGRLAAARTLAKYGTGIKVSQDGPISLFGLAEGEVAELLVMG